MPSKKANGKAPLTQQAFWAYLDQLDEAALWQDPAHIDDESLLLAYGLSSHESLGKDLEVVDKPIVPSCANRFSTSSTGQRDGDTPSSPRINGCVSVTRTDGGESSVRRGNGKKRLLNSDDANKDGQDQRKKRLKCCLENCAQNPKCLNWLGQEKWEESEAFEAFARAQGLDTSQTSERDPNVPVGLKNLGATCYINSYLQVWFQDQRFRAGVFACQPSPRQSLKDSPLAQLQITFAALQDGQFPSYNPVDLVSSLKLDQTEQQDSQEFAKLFMTLLDHEFRNQANPILKALVTDEFEGRLRYVTECMVCRKRSEREEAFWELEMNIAKGSTLDGEIQKMLGSEHLTANNQYRCENCDRLCDAARNMKLISLPPVLHFYLKRFNFDLKTMERKKSQLFFNFPLSVDMGKYMEPNSGNVWYDLKGVLMHEGQSAYHGHFRTQVFDASTDKWFLFDDEDVQALDTFGVTQSKDAERNGATLSEQGVLPDEGKEQSSDKEKMKRSKNAYMLIYTRRLPGIDAMPSGLKPPAVAQAQVEKLNKEYWGEMEEQSQRIAECRKKFDDIRTAKLNIFKEWMSHPSDNATRLASKQALLKWVSLEFAEKKTSVGATNTSGKDVGETPGEGPSTPGQGLESLTQQPPTTGENNFEFQPPDVLCEHGKVDPLKAHIVKRVKKRSLDEMKGQGSNDEATILTDLCRHCVFLVAADRAYRTTHRQHITLFEEVEDPTSPAFWISKGWLRDWQKPTPAMHERGRTSDPSPEQEPYHSHVVCAHGRVQPIAKDRTGISEGSAALFKSIFPNWRPVSRGTKECGICKDQQMETEENAQKKRDQASVEKRALKSLAQNARNMEQLPVPDDSTAYVIPMTFYVGWKRWVRNASAHERPQECSFRQLKCRHDLLLKDVGEDGELVDLVFITPQEWESIQSFYPADGVVSVEFSQTQGRLVSHPKICEECRVETARSLDEIEIVIRKQKGQPNTDLPPAEAREGSANLSNARQRSSRPVGVRRSRRSRRAPGHDVEKPVSRVIFVRKDDTIKDIKIKLADIFSRPTIYQRLFRGDKELENEDTIRQLDVLPKGVIDLYLADVDDCIDVSKLQDVDGPRKRHRSNGAEGFGGTLLGGSEFVEMSASHEPSSHSLDKGDQDLAGKVWCPSCTFANEPSTQNCEMCNTSL